MAILDTIQNAATTALGKINDSSSVKKGKTTLEFPSNLAELKRPIVRFSCTPHDGTQPLESICLPMQPNVAFSDGATYSTIDMGTVAAVAEVVKAIEGGEGVAGKAEAGYAQARDQIFSGGTIGAGIIASRKLGMENTAQTLEFASKQVVNPRTNTTFSGNTLRNFQFDFKLIGKSKTEVRDIDSIQNVFRSNLYASELGGQKVMLQFPSLWTIQFFEPDMSREIEFMPKIFTCFLTGLTTTVNSSSNTFRKDYSPYEIDISLQYQESKVLTRQEIERLNQPIPDRENADNAYLSEKQQDLKNLQSEVLTKIAEKENNT